MCVCVQIFVFMYVFRLSFIIVYAHDHCFVRVNLNVRKAEISNFLNTDKFLYFFSIILLSYLVLIHKSTMKMFIIECLLSSISNTNPALLLSTYYTKSSPVLGLHFSRRNVLTGCGPFIQPS